MAQEIRKIIFSEQDMTEIILHYCAKSGLSMPHARMTGFEIDADEGKGILISLKFDDPSLVNKISFNQGEIGAAMIMFCKTQKIPLPKNANKSLALHGENLALQVAIDWKTIGQKPKFKIKKALSA